MCVRERDKDGEVKMRIMRSTRIERLTEGRGNIWRSWIVSQRSLISSSLNPVLFSFMSFALLKSPTLDLMLPFQFIEFEEDG